MKRIVVVAAFALAVAAVVVILMYGRSRRPRNVVIVVLDAARADHIGCYGYPRDTTPNIDALAGESLRFARHYTPIPSTTPSTASLFTGQYPDTHRIIYPTWEHPEPEHTLASVLGEHGFATALFSSTLMASPEMDVGTRFQTAVCRERGDYTIGFQPDRLLARIEPWLDAHAAKAFFLYVHFIPPHGPYEELERFMDFEGTEAPGVEGCRPGDFEFPLYADGERPEEPEPPPLPRWADLYDANLCYGDWALGELVRMLRERDLLENTLLIVTSDHGEAFGEHGYIWHTNAIHQEVARIPLLIRPPGGVRPEARETLSDTTDVFPTVCEFLGLQAPDTVQGRSLLSGPPREYTVETSFVPRKYAIRTQDRALVLYEPATWRELYDLGEDLAERHNLAAERPEEVAALEAQLAEWAEGNAWARVDFAGDEEAPRHWMSDVGISEDTRDQLEALGYLH